ncbi:hypothetical protein GCK72_006844 [Caenorhabditis remanei]|uniref:NTF2-like domain-containing protein n=1 Tax=Caenorhabditis remanei TaxID=31234 RepID=A0A6A5HJM4_CAERE|nr:hypothetical protein GCK72_006844 [Caenorhabditis remanei]KAF1766886.1 hypothetical protein GCK72_006844 [Caenorhabditis remanei]
MAGQQTLCVCKCIRHLLMADIDRNFTDSGAYRALTEEEVLEEKNRTAYEIVSLFVMAASANNTGYETAVTRLEQRMEADFVAEICGDSKQMNYYQYWKYLAHNAALYSPGAQFKENYAILKTDRFELKFSFNIYRRDTMGVDSKLEFDITMKTTHRNGNVFGLYRIVQGGDCPDIGKVSHSNRDSFDLIIDDVAGINGHNRTKKFLDLFTPQPWQLEHNHPNDLPTTWLYKFDLKETKTFVCQEDVKDMVEYTISQFASWYFHFGTMWHPDAKMDLKEAFQLQVTQFQEDNIVARTTMKLQMGVTPDAPIRDWNFKFQAKNKGGGENWVIDRVEVLCSPEVKYKQESLAAIRDIVARKFVDYVEEQNVTQWYSTIDFVKEFSQNGKVEYDYCDGGTITKTSGFQRFFAFIKPEFSAQLQLFTHDMGQAHSTRFTKYWIDKEIEPTEKAPDTHDFHFKTMSTAATENPEFEYEHEWTVNFKWDQMDQFYHIDKLTMGCEKEYKDGEATAANYMIFNFGG